MRLGIIRHIRCDETAGQVSMVTVPEGWSPEQFEAAVLAAQAEYLAALKANKAPADPPNDYQQFAPPPYGKYPDSLVHTVAEEWLEKERVWRAWRQKVDAAARPFSAYLRDQGLQGHWDYAGESSVELDWGHNHGLRIRFD